MEADWFHIDLEEYIKLVRCRTQVIWLGQFIDIDNLKTIFEVNRIQVRALRLRSKPDWISFIGSCYSLACVNEKDNWKSVSGQKYRFLDWMSRGRKDLTRGSSSILYFARFLIPNEIKDLSSMDFIDQMLLLSLAMKRGKI